jgi:hypothetical protein
VLLYYILYTFLFHLVPLSEIEKSDISHRVSFSVSVLTIQRLFQPPPPQNSQSVIGVAIFNKRAEKEIFAEDRDRTQKDNKKESMYVCMHRWMKDGWMFMRTEMQNVEVEVEVERGGLRFYLTNRKIHPSFHLFSPLSNSSTHAPYF